jgi:cysteinyl-tRNA synthetase
VVARIDAAISDDLATPKVLALLDEALRRDLDPRSLVVVLDAVRTLTGIDLLAAAAATGPGSAAAAAAAAADDLDPAERTAIDDLVARREAARAARDFALADQLRDQLLADHATVVTDTPNGPTWRRTTPTPSA